MELSKNFEHRSAEEKWYQHWLEKHYFSSKPDERDPYTIVIPPPNVTGVLHMGHCLNNTIQDILIRRARMQGKNACWVPGTDHASIATEAKVVQLLREKGIQKASLSREVFLQYAWEWTRKYGGIILQQLKKLGCSLDWDRTCFTMDPDYHQSVMQVFVTLYNKGYIFRGKRMINWDPKAKTALSDEEVIYREIQSKLYYIRYKLDGEPDEYITIATVRPETILGDTAICVNPKDDRYRHLEGRYAYIPLINRRIRIIFDDYVAMEFGTGALKVTPAHDMNDYQLGLKHKLDVVDILNEDGTLNESAQLYIGEDRAVARRKITIELEEKNYITKIEDYTNQVGFSERTDEIIEPRLSLQWWVDMKKMSGSALDSVMKEDINFYPAKFKNLYKYWMENIRDWCISRQLWWGHRIPAWYDEEGNVHVAESLDELHNQKPKTKNLKLKQDEDCLDTWFSSWFWPFEVFHGLSRPGNEDVKYYYPTQTLVTAPEIIFFWVARMIMAGFEFMKEKPFSDVYFTGIVRDKLGRKMSKQLGNSPDLLELIDKYGADAVRFGIMIASPAGNDLLWDESSNEQGRNFNNKLWNALKLVKMWEKRQSPVASRQSAVASRQSVEDGENHFAVEWFENRLNQVKAEIEEEYKDFRLSEILKTLYSLIWDDFCSWYLEWVKPGSDQQIDQAVYEKTVEFFEELMQLLHPFMPFITEEIFHKLRERKTGDDLCIRQQIQQKGFKKDILTLGENLKDFISGSRDFRKMNDIKNSEPFKKVTIPEEIFGRDESIYYVLKKQLNIEDISIESPGTTDKEIVNSTTTTTIYPFKDQQIKIETEKVIDKNKRRTELVNELDYLKGFLVSVEKKLSNERFVQNAKPEIIALERKKKADAEAKIKVIEESLHQLN